jgi:hypothetical protein
MDKEFDPKVILRKFLFIPEKYTRQTKQEDRVIALVHRAWLRFVLLSFICSSYLQLDFSALFCRKGTLIFLSTMRN